MNKHVSGCIGVQVPITGNSKKIKFPFIDILEGKRIKHIDFCVNENLTLCPDGSANIAANVEKSIFLTFVEKNTQTELIQQLPATALTAYDDRLFINKIIDLPRSTVDVSACVSGDVVGKSLYFVFWFDNEKTWGIVPQKNNRTEMNFFELKLTKSRTYFAENIDLYKKRFQNILLSFPAITPNGNTGISEAYARNKFITLRSGSEEFFRQVPLFLFNQSKTVNRLRLQNITFDFQTSYIDTVGVTANDLKTVFFNCVIDANR